MRLAHITSGDRAEWGPLATPKPVPQYVWTAFEVTQPNIQKPAASGRILVELPCVKDKARVRELFRNRQPGVWGNPRERCGVPVRSKEPTRPWATTSPHRPQKDSVKATAVDTTAVATYCACNNDPAKRRNRCSIRCTPKTAGERKSKRCRQNRPSKSIADTAWKAFLKRTPLYTWVYLTWSANLC